MNIYIRITLCIIASSLLISCGEKKDDGVIEIVTTSTMVTDMVRTIVGDAGGGQIMVTGLIRPGLDPHNFELPATSFSILNNADLIIYNGMYLEEKMTDTFKKEGVRALAITDLLPKEELITAEQISEDHGDPHVWGDVELWSKAISGVVSKLAELAPEHAALFQKNAATYEAELLLLHEWAQKRMQEIPASNRTLITSHDAFGYLGRAYGIRVVGIKGLSTSDEAGGGAILATVDLINKENVKAIFPENATNDAEIKSAAKQAGVKIGDTLFADSCGAAGEIVTIGGDTYDKGTYVGMVRHNINTIVDALK